ncbi:MAG: hypothetical protein ABI412_00815 [Sphingomicrobium sp.]
MTRLLALLAALLIARPAAAASDLKGMHGVWQGTIGTLPVRACFDAGEYSSEGKYFYLKHLRMIPLVPDDKTPGELTEGWADTKGIARWNMKAVSGNRAEGIWAGNDQTMPIRLTRLPFATDQEFATACGSLAFIEPIFAATRILNFAGHVGGFAIEHWSLAFPDDSISIESFQLKGEGSAIEAINRRLREPFEKPGEGWQWCLRNAHAFGGDFDEAITTKLVTAKWLSVDHSNDSFCGGAHPNQSNTAILFDRRTGAIVNLYDWFASAAVRREEVDGNATIDSLGTALLRDVVGRIDFTEMQEDCRPAVETATSWDLALSDMGIAFTPSLPRIVMACGDTVVLRWKALTPYLNEIGKREVAALQTEIMKR